MKYDNKFYYKLTSEKFKGFTGKNDQIEDNIIEKLFGNEMLENIKGINLLKIVNVKDGETTEGGNIVKFPQKVLVIEDGFLEKYQGWLNRNSDEETEFNHDDFLTVIKKTAGSTCNPLSEEEFKEFFIRPGGGGNPPSNTPSNFR